MERKILDHGSIELLDYMGSDTMILETARVSTGAVPNPERDKGLMNFLIRNDHLTPLESCVFRFKVKAPIFVARQWVKHRMSSWNEKSMRYTEAKDIDFITPNWNKESATRGLPELLSEHPTPAIDSYVSLFYDDAKVHYNELLALGVAKEHARTVMPVGAYTEWIWTVNLRSLYNFLKLRTSAHAQKEIRVYAEEIIEILKDTGKFPYALESLQGMIYLNEQVLRLLNITKDPSIGADHLHDCCVDLEKASREEEI